jgi:hypothetical protein
VEYTKVIHTNVFQNILKFDLNANTPSGNPDQRQERTLCWLKEERQGDQIGRKFAQWVIVYFGQWFENYRSNAHLWLIFSTVPFMY